MTPAFPYRRVVLMTGHENGAVREKMRQSLLQLGPGVKAEVYHRKVRRPPSDPDTLVVVDVRFIYHRELDQVRQNTGSRFIEVRAGSGGLARQVLERLHLKAS